MSRLWLNMIYEKDLDCWSVVMDDDNYMIHCGEFFELCIEGDIGIPCRLELDRQWYIVMGSEGVKLDLKENEIYKIGI
ncbi:DUF5348 domain-containing protein [Niallia sp. RD1]|uniref:DUF5348 domain-containing protein n=1 Tax=Niallia sp. RD1 TaxID=2962858 RepID=UPI0020C194F8|nr:DUF5348 domain-containing protein [Niallia sp. RD1]UTI40056.1 DUF5348 domain-containing protein [Niallia sp. RD1]UTI40250.1 DUF5348 domain-containing protein [Niallia sp. RD1]UTI40709.1 DUF5348 domain-containing protein [Niallia sp. RD1]UTI41035.1 DUF5348 domain-containing protein [Niallia sp. RD1]UTI43288.1 DUF5348 domain-containing protein [Niallia sp. RD1]